MKPEQKMKALRASLKQAFRQWAKVDRSAVHFVAPYARAHKDVVPVDEANIATDLGPKLDKALGGESRLCVVGYDGATLAKKGYVWRGKVAKWLRCGCDVDYLLHTPAPAAIKALRDITRKLPSGSGRLRLFRPKRGAQLTPRLRSTLTEWRTFHFAVSERPPTLWIETNHKTSEPKAFDCYFFPESAARATGLAEVYRHRFDRVARTACAKVRLAAGATAEMKKPTTR